jgi:DNA-binding IclR family transcriptional regulator
MSRKPSLDLASSSGEEVESVSGALPRGLRIIELLVESPTPQTLSEVAGGSGLDSSTAYRLLQALVDRGYAVRDPENKRYMAGPRALSPLGMSHPLRELAREAAPILGSIRTTTGQTAGLVVFIGTQRVIVDTAPGDHPLVPYYDTWLRSPLHGSASGKILLASLSSTDRAALLGPGPYPAITPHTITNPAELERHLAEAIARGYAIARDDAFVGMTAIAAPIAYSSRAVGCMALIGRSDAMPKSSDTELGNALKNAAALLTHSAPSLRNVYYQYSCRGPVVAG